MLKADRESYSYVETAVFIGGDTIKITEPADGNFKYQFESNLTAARSNARSHSFVSFFFRSFGIPRYDSAESALSGS